MARRAKAAKKENAERWLLTYADLITLLMVFFVLLYAMSTTDARRFQDLTGALKKAFNNSMFEIVMPTGPNGPVPSSAAPQKTVAQKQNKNKNVAPSPIQSTYNKLKQAITKLQQQQAGLAQAISLGLVPEGIRISFFNDILFSPGEGTLKLGAAQLLAKVAALLKTLPNNIEVRGGTDNEPFHSYLYPTDWELSAIRAVSVVRYLVEKGGLPPTRLSAIGDGQYHPIVSNDTFIGRARNRRADIIIMYPQPTSYPLPPTTVASTKKK